MRAVLIGTGAADAVSLIVAVMGTLSHTTNALGWSTALIYLLSALGCGYFLIARSHKAYPAEARRISISGDYPELRNGVER